MSSLWQTLHGRQPAVDPAERSMILQHIMDKHQAERIDIDADMHRRRRDGDTSYRPPAFVPPAGSHDPSAFIEVRPFPVSL